MTTTNRLSGGSQPPRDSAPSSNGEGAARKATRIRTLPDPELDLICARLSLTELGNAERWRNRYGDDFRFCDVMGWFMWDGRRWKLLSEEKDAPPAELMQTVFHTVRAIRNGQWEGPPEPARGDPGWTSADGHTDGGGGNMASGSAAIGQNGQDWIDPAADGEWVPGD